MPAEKKESILWSTARWKIDDSLVFNPRKAIILNYLLSAMP